MIMIVEDSPVSMKARVSQQYGLTNKEIEFSMILLMFFGLSFAPKRVGTLRFFVIDNSTIIRYYITH